MRILYAASCAPFGVEAGGDGTIELFLSTLANPRGCDPGYACASGSCTTSAPVDAGPDGGSLADSSPCPDGRSECGGDCVDELTDAANCGSCGVVCLGGKTCVEGECVCPAGMLECAVEDGCVDAEHDPRHCGYCGHECGPRELCDGGECICTVRA